MKSLVKWMLFIAGVSLTLVLTWASSIRGSALNKELYEAVSNSDTSEVRHLLKDGANPNARWSPESNNQTMWDAINGALAGQRQSEPTMLAHAEEVQQGDIIMLKANRKQYK